MNERHCVLYTYESLVIVTNRKGQMVATVVMCACFRVRTVVSTRAERLCITRILSEILISEGP
jgi:hypothetical protein